MKRFSFCICAMLAGILGAADLHGGAVPAPEEQLRLLFKILSYEKRIASEPKTSPVVIGVIVHEGGAGAEWQSSMQDLVRLAGEYETAGRDIVLSFHAYHANKETIEWLRSTAPSVLVLSYCLEERSGEVLDAATGAGILTYTATDEHVHRGIMVTLLM